jgi:hypothetical protein
VAGDVSGPCVCVDRPFQIVVVVVVVVVVGVVVVLLLFLSRVWSLELGLIRDFENSNF